MKKKKILFIVNVDWFFISHRLPLALEAIKKGFDVYLACAITDKKEYLINLGIKIVPLSLSRSGMGIKKELKVFKEIYNTLKFINPDLVHFITIKPILYGGLIARLLGINKKVFSISGLGFIFINQGLKASVIRFIIKIIYKIALGGKNSHVIVQNPDDQQLVNSLVNVPITLIRGSGVDLKKYDYVSEDNDKIKVTMACRLLKDKGVLEYIKVAEVLKSKYPYVTFELFGDIDIHNPTSLSDADMLDIKQKNKIMIYGFTNNIAKVFSKSNIVVLPSYREGLPKVLIEAAACGRAVVTTNVPGCRDAIKENITGLLCNVKSVDSLQEQIEVLILDNGLRNNMGKSGRKLALKEFDIKKVVKKHFQIYFTNI